MVGREAAALTGALDVLRPLLPHLAHSLDCGETPPGLVLVADPEIVFYRHQSEALSGWVPAEIKQPLAQEFCLELDGHDVEWRSYGPALRRAAEFAEIWAENLKNQGWLERGRRVEQ